MRAGLDWTGLDCLCSAVQCSTAFILSYICISYPIAAWCALEQRALSSRDEKIINTGTARCTVHDMPKPNVKNKNAFSLEWKRNESAVTPAQQLEVVYSSELRERQLVAAQRAVVLAPRHSSSINSPYP